MYQLSQNRQSRAPSPSVIHATQLANSFNCFGYEAMPDRGMFFVPVNFCYSHEEQASATIQPVRAPLGQACLGLGYLTEQRQQCLKQIMSTTADMNTELLMLYKKHGSCVYKSRRAI